MKKTLVFAMALALGVSATAFAANPFSDVPAGHWAYAAVAQLAADGVVTGYADGTFKGDATMTRYEMAQIVAKGLAKGTVNENDALVAEFADELDNLGVRVAKLEKKSDNVKLTGSLRYRYMASDIDDNDTSELRTRIGVAGMINNDWTYKALIENDKNFAHDIASNDDDTEFRRAWLTGKIGQVGVTAGRWDYTVLNGNVFDDEMDGAKLDFAAGDFDLSLAAGREDVEDVNDTTVDLFIATAMTQIGAVDATLAYYNIDANVYDVDEDDHFDVDANIFSIGLSGTIAEDLTLGGTYIKSDIENDNGDDDGYVLALNYKAADKKVVGSYGLAATYYDQADTTFLAHTTDATTDFDGGFKGYALTADYTVAKNMVATLGYFDTEAKIGNEDESKIMTQLYMFF